MTTEITATLMINDEIFDLDRFYDGVPITKKFIVVTDHGDEDDEPGIRLESNDAIFIWFTPAMARTLLAEVTRALAELHDD